MLQEANAHFFPFKTYTLQCAYEISHGAFEVLTRCLNSADRLPLLDSSMFITLVFVPRMLNLRDLDEERGEKNTTQDSIGLTFMQAQT